MYLVSLVRRRQQHCKFSSVTILAFFLVTLLTRTNFLSLEFEMKLTRKISVLSRQWS